jgi:hypothetical protein
LGERSEYWLQKALGGGLWNKYMGSVGKGSYFMVSYSILIEFGVPMKMVRLIKMCLNETYSKVDMGKHFYNSFHIPSGIRQGDALSPRLFSFGLEYAIKKAQENQVGLKLHETLQ